MSSDEEYSLKLTSLLFKLKVAGLQRRCISIGNTLVKDGQTYPSNMCFKFAVISLSIDFAVTVPYDERDKNLDFH